MVYPHDFEIKTGFDRIRKMVSDKCLSPLGMELAEAMIFMTDYQAVQCEVSKTWEFQQLLSYDDPFPSENYFDISGTLNKLRIEGAYPEVKELFDMKRSLECLKSVLNYLRKRDEGRYPLLKSLASGIKFYSYVTDSIERIIDRNGNIRDNASPELMRIRKEIIAKKLLVSKMLSTILKSAQAEGIVEPDANISVRNGRGVIPVNVAGKRRISGLIHDQSDSGKTVYIEPAEIVELNNEIVELEYGEKREIIRILATFADNIRIYIDDLLLSNRFLGEIDFIRAKALLGIQLVSVKPVIIVEPHLCWRGAIHPLLYETFKKLPGRKVVPLDISLDEKNRMLLVSGPNAGGKSVCLKTVGLLQYMLQCGLTIPVQEGSESGIFKNIFIDIGDEQSIENDLSTYSSHLINMKFFLKNATKGTLILIDELGSGTEPVLGGAIAEAILSELIKTGACGVITTHYSNLKHFASVTDGIINGAMTFDNHLMQPLFRLDIGKPGSSFAFEIARKIGFPGDILNDAAGKAGAGHVDYDRHLKDIARDKRYWERKRQNIRQHEKRLEKLIDEYEKELASAKNLRKEIISEAKEEAQRLLDESNRIIENTIRQIKEAQAEKEKTKRARQELDKYRKELAEGKVIEVEGKIEEFDDKVNKVRGKIQKTKPVTEISGETGLKVGDAVRMTDTLAVGEIVEIEGEMVTVEAGSFRFQISAGRLEKVSRSELKKSLQQGMIITQSDPLISQRKLNFKPEIDIRGIRGEEAISIVRNLIDDAVMVQHRNLRIIHGKGNGILRHLIRQYLSTVNVVKSFSDEHVERGGAGITLVELDL
ncbi:MAG: endonuclease MutS2 [Bacteroidales bacterium]